MAKNKFIPPKPTRYQFDSEAEYAIQLQWWERDYGRLPPAEPEEVKPEADPDDDYL